MESKKFRFMGQIVRLNDILRESLLDDEIDADITINTYKIESFLDQYAANENSKGFKKEFEDIIRTFNLDKYKTYGWDSGRKLIGIMNDHEGFYLADSKKEKFTYCIDVDNLGWFNTNITEFTGTRPGHCKLYNLPRENEWVYDVIYNWCEKYIRGVK